VTVNGVAQGTYRPTQRIVAYGQAGNDVIVLAEAKINGRRVVIGVPALLDGGDGNDVITASGSSADNILLGQAGLDILTARAGRDLLIGGRDSDLLYADGGDDILIGGSTVHDNNTAALDAVMAEWSRRDIDAATRVRHLLGDGDGANGDYLLDSGSVLDDRVI